MKNRYLLIVLCLIICAFQILILSSVVSNALLIADNEQTVRLRCRLVDPMDIMKGRYIHLDFDPELENIQYEKMPSLAGVSSSQLEEWKHRTLYCIMQKDEDGCHTVIDATFEKPSNDVLFIKFRIEKIRYDSISLQIHFENYYMQEQYALEADLVVRDRDFESLNPVLILSVGKNGKTVQQGFEIEGMQIEEYLDRNVFDITML